MRKLATRDPERHSQMKDQTPTVHSIFRVIPGEIESWEILTSSGQS